MNNHGIIRGTVTLVALCFTAVMGITLAGYIAVCSRAMNLSNRTFQNNLSKQLAEIGIDEALRAFNKNDWSNWSSNPTNVTSGAWTLDTINKRATRTITFDTGKLGQGITGTIKLRIDNYDANQLDSTWSSSVTYRIGALVGYNGIWYRSVRSNNTNQTPSTTNLTWWVQNPMPWTWRTSAPYSQYDMVNYSGLWYRCLTAHTSHATTFSSDSSWAWAAIPTQRTWSASTDYDLYDVVAYTDSNSVTTLYRCTTAHTSSASFSSDAANWSSNVRSVSLNWTGGGTVYTRGAIVYYTNGSSYAWYICIQSGASSIAPLTDTTMWAPIWIDYNPISPYLPTAPTAFTIPVAPSDTGIAGTEYYVGDYMYNGGTWYRCITDHTYNNWSSDEVKWSSTNAVPILSLFYRGTPSQTSNNIIFYAGSTWYRYISGYGWYPALTGSMHLWSSGSIKYNLGDAVYYSGTARWYRCILAHTSSGSIVPTNTTYWSTAPLLSRDWDSVRQYSLNDTVRYQGVRYISIHNGTSNIAQNPATATSYWVGANTSTTSYQWNATTTYATGDYKCYGGVWYKCTAATTANAGQSPNNTSYWTATWAQGSGVTTGAPVVYAEGTIAITGSPSITTQLRATLAAAPLFPNAVAATSTISANSGGTVDSYDSVTGTYASQVNSSTNYSAVVAAGDTSGTAVTLSSTAVNGYVAAPSSSTSPYAPLFSSGGSVKSSTSPASPNIDLTRVSRSPYIPQFDTLPVNSSGGGGGLAANWATVHKGTPLPLFYTINLGTPGDTTPSRYYYNGDLTVGTGSLNVLRINGPVILYINGDLNIDDAGSVGRIDIASTGSAEIHLAGEFKASAGGQGIQNFTADPKKLIIISDTTSTSSHYYSEGVNPLYGVVYVPYSTSNTGYYNDNNSTHVYGAISANKITYSGANLNVHYDTSLRYATFGGVDQPYTVSEWRELPVTEQATMP